MVQGRGPRMERLRQMAELRAQGLRMPEIACRLGITERAVHDGLRVLVQFTPAALVLRERKRQAVPLPRRHRSRARTACPTARPKTAAGIRPAI